MKDSEILSAFWEAKTNCQACYYVRIGAETKKIVYSSPTPEQRTEKALNALQRVIGFSRDGEAEKAREAIGECRKCLKDGRPEGPLISEYLTKQMP